MSLWDQILPDVVSGVIVALAVAGIAVFLTGRYTARRAQADARRARNLAAVAELYRVNGEFFAVWKVWEFHESGGSRTKVPVDDHRRSELIALAASAEGGYESLLVRVALEHDLNPDQKAALWALRTAFKQLRYAMRDGRPLEWWRSESHGGTGFREYQAHKALVAIVADIFTQEPARWAPSKMRPSTWGRTSESEEEEERRTRAESLRQVTGDGKGGFLSTPAAREREEASGADLPEWTLLAEKLDRDGFREVSTQVEAP